MGTDMKSLCKEMIFRIIPDLNQRAIMLGTTKLYIKEEGNIKMDNKLKAWIAFKIKQAQIIKNAIKKHIFRKKVKIWLKNIKYCFQKFNKLAAQYKGYK